MKLFVLACVILLFSSFGMAAPLSKTQAQPLIAKVEQLNDACRGGSGDNQKTMEYCDKRDQLVTKLSQGGWCFGSPEQYEYEKKWQRCVSVNSTSIDPNLQRVNAVALYLMPGALICHDLDTVEVVMRAMQEVANISNGPDSLRKAWELQHGQLREIDPSSFDCIVVEQDGEMLLDNSNAVPQVTVKTKRGIYKGVTLPSMFKMATD
ncbi:hypothetical protein [Silvimonas soli]|uniref:hypothetical protein n=1 Tax=Silvimonas soli TaxID=2980100 RepID=UPI0024B3BCC0|nr:hypothetical protein [Silvimonas soli]